MDYSTESPISYTIDTTYTSPIVKEKIYKYRYNENEYDYKIITNDSSLLCEDDCANRPYRSVIFNHKDRLVCFSPPNSISVDKFMEKYPIMNEDIHMNIIMEGTMVNLFYDFDLETWEISTRGSIGGNYWYFRNEYVINKTSGEFEESAIQSEQVTFRNMFLDALRGYRDTSLNNNNIIACLDKSYCYSFVLQHPANHIVVPVKQPNLFLVAVYKIENNVATPVPPTVYEQWTILNELSGIIDFPPTIKASSYNTVKDHYCSVHSHYSIMGIMLYNSQTGLRAAMQNPLYEDLKKLRGNNPNLQYQFFCLLKVNQCSMFLSWFPMYKNLFGQFNKQYQDFITNVHQSYFSYYVKKEGLPIAKKFFIHVSRIHHQVFIPSLTSGEKVIINRNAVKKYFDDMTPSELLYYLNYDKRQSSRASTTEESVAV